MRQSHNEVATLCLVLTTKRSDPSVFFPTFFRAAVAGDQGIIAWVSFRNPFATLQEPPLRSLLRVREAIGKAPARRRSRRRTRQSRSRGSEFFKKLQEKTQFFLIFKKYIHESLIFIFVDLHPNKEKMLWLPHRH